jgi:hypothetical protein
MIPGKNFKPESLSKWLGIATCGLAASGKERITREIDVHFAEAVEAHLAQGEPEPVAQAKAIVELGDPVAAAKRFRRSCLMEEERLLLSKLLARTGKAHTLLFSLLAPAILLGFMFFAHFQMPSLMFDMVLLLLFALPIISFITSRLYGTKSKARLLLFIELACDVLTALAATLFGMETLHENFAVFVGIAGGTVAACIQKLRILNKGRRLLDDLGDIQGLAE